MSAAWRTRVSTRFWFGIALPALLLLGYILFLVLATGGGREWAPVVALMYGLLSIPATMLAGCWLLFVDLPRSWLVAAGLLAPAYVAVALAIFVHGSQGGENAGATMLEPYFRLVEPAQDRWTWLFVAWLVAMAALIALAVRRERRLLQ